MLESESLTFIPSAYGAMLQVTSTGSIQVSCQPPRSVAAICSRLVIRGALALLLMVAVGSAEAVESSFHALRPAKAARNGSGRAARTVRGGGSFLHLESLDGICPLLRSLEQHATGIASACLAILRCLPRSVAVFDILPETPSLALLSQPGGGQCSTPYLPNPPPVPA